MTNFLLLTRAEDDLIKRCMNANILNKRPDHPLSQFLLQVYRARHYADVCLSGEGPHPHTRLVEAEIANAAARLNEWRGSEHHAK